MDEHFLLVLAVWELEGLEQAPMHTDGHRIMTFASLLVLCDLDVNFVM